jgi:hypothetical protein
MQRLTRVIRAFFKALMMTLRGEAIQPPEERYPNLSEWVERGQKLRINRRDISAETILAAVQHNMHTEYPRLLDARIEHNLTTLYAMNMNDQYRVTQLAQADDLPDPVKEKIAHLRDHLNNIPSSQNP